MRIVAGRHKGRPLTAPKGLRVRPTSDRAREALFNVLVHGAPARGGGSPLAGARVLDAFCGTGALGLEALSRGAGEAVFMDASQKALEAVRANAERLGEEGRVRLVRANAARPPLAAAPSDLVFLDPPYGSGLGAPALAALAERGWLAPAALAVVEVAAREPFAAPDGFETLGERVSGAARFVILRRKHTSPPRHQASND
jgi:16S rRNA (guanine966-N2)-methyltransferase